MSMEKPTVDKDPTKVLAEDPDEQKSTLERIGGSQSDQWNNVLGNQTLRSLWIADSNKEARDRQYGATIAGLIGIGPKDEIEGMIAAQLIATHNAAMECYRRAMMGEQTFEDRRENLSQATKLSRTYTVLLEAFNRHRGKGGQQKVLASDQSQAKLPLWLRAPNATEEARVHYVAQRLQRARRKSLRSPVASGRRARSQISARGNSSPSCDDQFFIEKE